MTYIENLKPDILDMLDVYDYLVEESDNIDEFKERLEEVLWTDDFVTGYGSGSYFFNSSSAKEFIIENLDEVCEALRELDSRRTFQEVMENPEETDVLTRCYYLRYALLELYTELEEFYKNKKKEA